MTLQRLLDRTHLVTLKPELDEAVRNYAKENKIKIETVIAEAVRAYMGLT